MAIRAGLALCLIVMALLLSLSGCGGMSKEDYLSQIRPQMNQYNSARDVVDRTIEAADSAVSLQQALGVARRGVADLEGAINEMNSAYKALGSRDFPKAFHEHQQATLSAWRAGIEATIASKLYLENFLAGELDDSVLVAANRLFAEEDRYQLEARRSL